jgi:dipeptidase E
MKLLLTSAGVKNASIRDALVELLGKPIEESNALLIPTASYGHRGGQMGAYRFITGAATTPMAELGWKSLGVLELSTLPTLSEDYWRPSVAESDILLVNGGDALYLAYWLRASGLADVLESMPEMVWMGLSAGSMAMTPKIGADFIDWLPPGGADVALGIVDFAIFPHLDHPALPENTTNDAERWAADMSIPCYAIDDETAIKVVDGTVEVISEGHWKLLNA